MIVLNELNIPAYAFFELPFVIAFEKKAPIVTKDFGFDDEQILDGGVNRFQLIGPGFKVKGSRSKVKEVRFVVQCSR